MRWLRRQIRIKREQSRRNFQCWSFKDSKRKGGEKPTEMKLWKNKHTEQNKHTEKKIVEKHKTKYENKPQVKS